MKLGKGKNTKPHPLRKSGKKAMKKEKRRIEAQQRQSLYDALTNSEKKEQRAYFKERYEAQIRET